MESVRKPPLAQLRPRDHLFYVSRDRSVLATGRDGFIAGDDGQGFFCRQTRMLSLYRYRINGESPKPVGVTNLEEHNQIAYYIVESPGANRDLMEGALGPGGEAATEAIELQSFRIVDDGFQDSVELTNHTQQDAKLKLEIEIDADFADATETHGKRKQHGSLDCEWKTEQGRGELTWTYTAEHQFEHQGHSGKAKLRRGARVTVETSSGEVEYSTFRKRLQFRVELSPHGTWSSAVRLAPQIEGCACQPRRGDNGIASKSSHDNERGAFLKKAAELQLSTPPLAFVVQQAFAQSRRDLVSFRLYDLDRDGGWTFAAGLPVYLAFFGRDALISSWQASTLGTEMLRGSLAYLAETQATETDDWRDAEPGKFVHQMETGPVAMLDYNVNARYYGSITSPGFYPIALSDLFHWTGEKSLVDRYLNAARKGLAWLDREARRDDGFYQYQRRSEQGVKNQAWKDSYDAIVYPDGALAKDPIAPAEFQAFVFAAKVRMSELLWWLGEKEASRKVFEEAITLRGRYNEAYWMEDEGCYGMGLDGSGRLIRSVGSESAHALASGIVPRERVDRVVDRMFRPDMFSGWGIRTLSSAHRAYNPFSYHRGSVWPAEQASFAMGLMRYGLHEKLHRLTRSFFETASVFEYYRLPELFAGHPRDERHPVPALYPEADSPQAWSAAAVPCMIQALVGLFPYAPLESLFVDPHLPEWLPEFTLTNIRVGSAAVDLRFYRKPDGSSDYEPLDVRGKLHIVHQPSPWSLTADSAERASDLLQSLVSG